MYFFTCAGEIHNANGVLAAYECAVKFTITRGNKAYWEGSFYVSNKINTNSRSKYFQPDIVLKLYWEAFFYVSKMKMNSRVTFTHGEKSFPVQFLVHCRDRNLLREFVLILLLT